MQLLKQLFSDFIDLQFCTCFELCQKLKEMMSNYRLVTVHLNECFSFSYLPVKLLLVIVGI